VEVEDMKNIVVLVALAPAQALAMGGGSYPPPNPCAGQPGTVLVDGTYRTTNIQAALNQAHATPGHHTVEICSGLWQEFYGLSVSGDIAISAPDGPEVTVIEGTGTADAVFWLGGPAGVPSPSLSCLTIRGPVDAVRVTTSARTELVGVHLSGSTAAGLRAVGPASTVVVWDSIVEGNGGSGVVLESYGSIDLAGTTVRGNTGNYGGGVHLVQGGTVLGGTVEDNLAYFGGGGVYGYSTVMLYGTVITGNEALFGGGVGAESVVPSGVTITGNDAVSGGGIWGSAVSLAGSNTVQGNTAELGGGVFAYAVSGTDSISGNVAQQGGGVYLYGVGGLVEDVEITGNTATEGGGIYVSLQDGGSRLAGAYVHDNQAERGGGVYMGLWEEVISLAPGAAQLDLDVDECLITANTATIEGGGLYAEVGLLESAGSALDANDAPSGGGLSLASGAGAALAGGSVRDNTGHGAALTGDIYLYSSSVDWTGNSPGAILFETSTQGTPSEEFVCNELTGCLPRQTGGGGDVLQ
jgi:hypothetical protein